MLKEQHTFQSHGTLSDFDVLGNYLITCGYSERNGIFISDPFLMVYDLRMMRAIAPVAMPNFSPYLLRFIPKFVNRICVVSQVGQFQLLDINGSLQAPPFIHNVGLPHGASLTSFDVSSTSQALAFGDDQNVIYLFGSNPEGVNFNMYSQPTEFADPIEPVRQIPMTDQFTPLSIIPMPFYDENEKLLSDFPPEMCKRVYKPVQQIDGNILDNMKSNFNNKKC